jgi:signal transduction histidine kinase
MKNVSKENCTNLEERLKIVTRESEEKIQKISSEFQELSRRLLEDQERERNAIGRELHDEVGGYLTILGIYLSKMNKEPENTAWRKQFVLALDEMVQYVRSLSHSLYPIMLEQGDLLAAIVSYLDSYQRRTGIKCILKYHGLEERLPMHLEAVVYRIIQEALTNVAKHASAQKVKVNISRTKTSVKLSVEDDGRGFDVSKVRPARAYGISGMKNRALFAGGTLEVHSTPGQGTSVVSTLPIMQSQENHQPVTVTKD